jgi:hypothetical protein
MHVTAIAVALPDVYRRESFGVNTECTEYTEYTEGDRAGRVSPGAPPKKNRSRFFEASFEHLEAIRSPLFIRVRAAACSA